MTSKVAVFAPFSGFTDSYSLAHVVCDQVRALRLAGYQVELWCLTDAANNPNPVARGIDDALVPCVRPRKFVRDNTDPARYNAYARDLLRAYRRFRPDHVVTHDVVFQADYVDFGRAVHVLAPACTDASWFHYLHSTLRRDVSTPKGDTYWRRRIPDGHHIIFPNEVARDDVAATYAVSPSRVFGCANPHDPRPRWRIREDSARIVSDCRLMEREIVQIYPFCATRLDSKGVPYLVAMFDEFVRAGRDACVVLCDANANTPAVQNHIERVIDSCKYATRDNIVFLSRKYPSMYRHSVPHDIVTDLFHFSNYFFFPTMGEACPLILAEAASVGCVMTLNGAVPALREYAPRGSQFVNLSSFSAVDDNPHGHAARVKDAATTALWILDNCPSVASKRYAFRTFSLEAAGRNLTAIFNKATRSDARYDSSVQSRTTEPSRAVKPIVGFKSFAV